MWIDNLNATTDEADIYFENKLPSELAPLTESAKTSWITEKTLKMFDQ